LKYGQGGMEEREGGGGVGSAREGGGGGGGGEGLRWEGYTEEGKGNGEG